MKPKQYAKIMVDIFVTVGLLLLMGCHFWGDAAHEWVGADLSLLETFLAIGIDELSVPPSAVLPLRAKIRSSIAQTCTLEKLGC